MSTSSELRLHGTHGNFTHQDFSGSFLAEDRNGFEEQSDEFASCVGGVTIRVSWHFVHLKACAVYTVGTTSLSVILSRCSSDRHSDMTISFFFVLFCCHKREIPNTLDNENPFVFAFLHK